MKRKQLLALRILLIFLTIAVMVVIFMLSADNADESNVKSALISDSLIYRILSSFDWNEEQIEQIASVTVFLVRKTAHFSEYAALGFLLAGVCLSFGRQYGFLSRCRRPWLLSTPFRTRFISISSRGGAASSAICCSIPAASAERDIDIRSLGWARRMPRRSGSAARSITVARRTALRSRSPRTF